MIFFKKFLSANYQRVQTFFQTTKVAASKESVKLNGLLQFLDCGVEFLFLFQCYKKVLQANSEDPDQMSHNDLGLHYLPLIHLKEARLICANNLVSSGKKNKTPLEEYVIKKYFLLICQSKHMMQILKRSDSMRRFF